MEPSKKKLNQFTLANNCPECYAQDAMILTFYQKRVKNSIYEKVSKQTGHSILCQKCKQTIYPVKWTEDIERVYNFYLKTLTPEPSLKLTKLGLFLIIFIVLLIAGLLIFWPQQAVNLQ
ncbi:hypothetical protein MQE36_03985 [Zhouia spongiae]|uniref:CpXC domain-containing protein n=1 Tax=Zhouia spongiae TaxID=2202721 RepID=A0ABY3YPE6_9FLAO|nr:hypothetical protein [Zhouia spongiae]UNY99508.1 hypothetical protein MQE36_03985 [Zhouia spongiae]